MDQRTRILTEIYRNKSILNSIKRAANGKNERFEDELTSFVFLVLCEMDSEKLIRLYNDNQLIPFVSGLIINQKHFTRGEVNLQDNYVPNRANNEIKLNDGDGYLIDFLRSDAPINDDSCDIRAAIEKLNWFQKQVVEYYITYGSVKEIVKHTALSEKYVLSTLNLARQKIKNALNIN